MRVLIVCLLLAVALPSSLGLANRFYGTFSSPGKDPQRKSSFFELPRKVTTSDGWALEEDRLKTDGVTVYCRNKDFRVCLLFDKKQSIAGVQISLSVEDFKKTGAPIKPQLVRKKVAGVDVYSGTIYFVDQSVLKAGGRSLYLISETAPNGFYVPTPDGSLRRIPLTEKAISDTTKYTRQGCIPNMGRHYFYNLSKQMTCDQLEVFFALYHEQKHQLVGGGMVTFVTSTPPKSGRVWLEAPPSQIIKVITPGGPECSAALALQHGLSSFHFYFVDQPWNLKC